MMIRQNEETQSRNLQYHVDTFHYKALYGNEKKKGKYIVLGG